MKSNEGNIEKASSPETEKLRVGKVHLLIHPGTLTSYFELGRMLEKVDKYSELLDRYVEKAETVAQTPDEIMVIFVPHSKEKIKTNIAEERADLTKLQMIKRILGRRAIFISDNHNPVFHESRSVMELVKKIASTRGYQIENTVASEAYGEWLHACVTAGAVQLNEAANWQNKTTVRPELTDLAISSDPRKDLDYYLQRLDSAVIGPNLLRAKDFVEVIIPDDWNEKTSSSDLTP